MSIFPSPNQACSNSSHTHLFTFVLVYTHTHTHTHTPVKGNLHTWRIIGLLLLRLLSRLMNCGKYPSSLIQLFSVTPSLIKSLCTSISMPYTGRLKILEFPYERDKPAERWIALEVLVLDSWMTCAYVLYSLITLGTITVSVMIWFYSLCFPFREHT